MKKIIKFNPSTKQQKQCTKAYLVCSKFMSLHLVPKDLYVRFKDIWMTLELDYALSNQIPFVHTCITNPSDRLLSLLVDRHNIAIEPWNSATGTLVDRWEDCTMLLLSSGSSDSASPYDEASDDQLSNYIRIFEIDLPVFEYGPIDILNHDPPLILIHYDSNKKTDIAIHYFKNQQITDESLYKGSHGYNLIL